LSVPVAAASIEGEPPQLELHPVDVVRLRGRDGGEQPRHRIERAVGVVARERFLVRPLVAPVAQLLHQRALGAAERAAEDVVPRLPHELQQRRHVPLASGFLATVRSSPR
jgi:hypothetical protein